MIERAAVRFNPDDWYEMEVDTDAVSCAVHGFMNGEPIDFSGGGDTPSVVGDFTPESGGVNVLEIPYNGGGYPIVIVIWAEELPVSMAKAHGFTAIHKYSNDTPSYDENNTSNSGSLVYMYNSANTDYYSNGNIKTWLYNNVEAPESGVAKVIRIFDKKTIKYYALTSGGGYEYGFAVNTKYNYLVLYSE